jgi:hypothetical protein
MPALTTAENHLCSVDPITRRMKQGYQAHIFIVMFSHAAVLYHGSNLSF